MGAGFFTNGLPRPTSTNGALPLPAGALIPVDTGLPNGQNPQSVGATLQDLLGNGGFQAITYGANIAINAQAGLLYGMTFGAGNATLAISNLAAGAKLRLRLVQDGVGSRTLTVTAGSGGATQTSGTPLTASASAIDIVEIQNVGTTAAPIYAYYPVAKAFS